jgi:hypothetical protein
MKEDLELVIIGDSLVKGKVYESFGRFKANYSDEDQSWRPLLGRRVNAEFILDNNTISYGVYEYKHATIPGPEEGEYALNRPFLLKEHLSVVVCIDGNTPDLDIGRFDEFLLQISAIRSLKPFNIIPMIISTQRVGYYTQSEIYQHFTINHPQLVKNVVVVGSHELDNPNYTTHLSIALDASLTTPFYNEMQNCIQLLNTLEQHLVSINVPVTPHIPTILNILRHSLGIIGIDDSINMDTLRDPSFTRYTKTKDLLRNYFNENRQNLQSTFDNLRNDLDTNGIRSNTYIGGMILNVFCSILFSIAAIFAILTIVGIPLVSHILSQNLRYHNHSLKFFATNNIDVERAHVAKAEDQINRTVLSII